MIHFMVSGRYNLPLGTIDEMAISAIKRLSDVTDSAPRRRSAGPNERQNHEPSR